MDKEKDTQGNKNLFWRSYLIPSLLVLLGGVFVWWGVASEQGQMEPRATMVVAESLPPTATTTLTATPPPSATPEQIVPTRTPTPLLSATPTGRATRPTRTPSITPTPRPTLTPLVIPESSPTAVLPRPTTNTNTPSPSTSNPTTTETETTSDEATPSSPPATAQGGAETSNNNTAVVGPIANWQRFGVAVPAGKLNEAQAAGLRFGAYLNWWPGRGSGDTYWPMIRVNEQGIRQTSWAELEQLIAQRPGSYWLVGNEMDVKWQDNVTPERYAEIYHEVYTFIKGRDPSALVAIGGVSQPTPLRRAYLDRVLNHYQSRYGTPMPIDIWNVHAFVLREEAGSWGVDIPPGMSGAGGMLYEIEDHTNMGIFRQNLIDFRRWMAERGYGDKPLVITEYGILMPPDYGFGPDVAADFLRQTLDFFTTAVDSTGYAPDGGRLVQWWFWYGVWEGPERYPAGNLYDPETNQLTPAGRVFSEYPR